jgi:signal transduction histidine kinase
MAFFGDGHFTSLSGGTLMTGEHWSILDALEEGCRAEDEDQELRHIDARAIAEVLLENTRLCEKMRQLEADLVQLGRVIATRDLAASPIEDRNRAEQERERLRELEADLAHANRVSMLGELAASLSHELKQPITAAIANANACLLWLERDRPDIEEALEAVTSIVKDGYRAVEIINCLRSLYTRGAPAEREVVDLNELVGEMLILLRSEAKRHSIPMLTDLVGDLPRATIDRVQLQQVLLNLMLNGIEAMKDSGGELTIKSQLGNDGQLHISVSDTGMGLPSEKADQIFNAFFTTKPQGSGMGLAISRSIVESHGGRLWATTNSGRGATFQFTLPSLDNKV